MFYRVVSRFELVRSGLTLIPLIDRLVYRRDTKLLYMTPEDFDKALDAFHNRPIYRVLTRKILDSVNDNDLEQTILDNISELLKESGKDEFLVVQRLSPGQRSLYTTWWVEAEVNNGGFNQFYFNSSGQYSLMAVEGFRLFGATKHMQLMERANATYLSNVKNLERFNDGTLESFSESYKNNPLNELDDLFYKLEQEENLSQLRIRYIRSHVEEFIQE